MACVREASSCESQKRNAQEQKKGSCSVTASVSLAACTLSLPSYLVMDSSCFCVTSAQLLRLQSFAFSGTREVLRGSRFAVFEMITDTDERDDETAAGNCPHA
uniref:Polyketide synthase n=1 Tax=Peronospora matthiolae TaxID=2874970 RepID=A0AAV1TEL3_9STRA